MPAANSLLLQQHVAASLLLNGTSAQWCSLFSKNGRHMVRRGVMSKWPPKGGPLITLQA